MRPNPGERADLLERAAPARSIARTEKSVPRPVDQLLGDPEAAKRLEKVVKGGNDVRGDIVEDIGLAQLREALKTPAGRAELLPETARDSDVRLFEGAHVRGPEGPEADGRSRARGRG